MARPQLPKCALISCSKLILPEDNRIFICDSIGSLLHKRLYSFHIECFNEITKGVKLGDSTSESLKQEKQQIDNTVLEEALVDNRSIAEKAWDYERNP